MALLRREGATFVVCVLLILLSSVTAPHPPPPDCSFEYRRQPPSTTLNGCNPYHTGTTIVIVLECVVRRRAMIDDEFEVRWFRENTTGAVENLGLGNPNVQQGMDQLSRYHETEFINKPYSPSLLGKYWCQVINTTADPDQPLMRSNVFTLLAPGDYSGTTCSAFQFVENQTCADLPADQPVDLTTTTVPVPVPTTSTQMAPIAVLSTTTQPTVTTASVTSDQTIAILPSVTTNQAVTMLPSVTTNQAITMLSSVTSDQAVTIVTSAQTPAASSSPSSTPILTTQEQTSPFLYVIASIGGIFLITIIVLIVVIAVMLLKKRGTDHKGVGIDNGAYGLNEMNAAPGKPEIHSFQKSIEDSPEDYAEPILTLQRAGYPAPPPPAAANGGRNLYSAMNTPTQHVVNHHYSMVGGEPIVPPDSNYSCLQHDTSPQQPASSPYSKLDHSQPNTNMDVPATALYSSLEDSNAPLYNTLQAPGEDSDSPDYSNIAPNRPEENGAVHPHYVGEYARATNHPPPTSTGANSQRNGKYKRDPPY